MVLKSLGRGEVDSRTVQGSAARREPTPEQLRSRRCLRYYRLCSPAALAMALSMPLNGLKEEDKEPIIELFVKVSARLPSRPAEHPALAGRWERRPWARGAP